MFKFEVAQTPSGEWRVERIREDRDGEIEVTSFTGGRNEERAREYAALMNQRLLIPASRSKW